MGKSEPIFLWVNVGQYGSRVPMTFKKRRNSSVPDILITLLSIDHYVRNCTILVISCPFISFY